MQIITGQKKVLAKVIFSQASDSVHGGGFWSLGGPPNLGGVVWSRGVPPNFRGGCLVPGGFLQIFGGFSKFWGGVGRGCLVPEGSSKFFGGGSSKFSGGFSKFSGGVSTGIRSTFGRYASYWNAFLFSFIFF